MVTVHIVPMYGASESVKVHVLFLNLEAISRSLVYLPVILGYDFMDLNLVCQ